MKKQTTYKKLRSIRRLIVNTTIDGYVYRKDWSKDFRIKEIDKIPEILSGWEKKENDNYTKLQPSDLTREQMIELEFGKWCDDDPMYLIPLWMYPFLADKIATKCIDGKVEYMDKADMDIESRFGCLAYGVIPCDFPKEK